MTKKNIPITVTANSYEQNRASTDIINKVSKVEDYRFRITINDWRDALTDAERVRFPNTALMQILYKELALDPHIKSQMDLRKSTILGYDIIVCDKSGNEDLTLTEFIQSSIGIKYLDYTLDCIFYGAGLIETPENQLDKLYLWDREFVLPDASVAILGRGRRFGFNYKSDEAKKYFIPCGQNEGYGILAAAVPYFIWKRDAMQSLTIYNQLFAVPMRYATVETTNANDIEMIEKALSQMGTASYAVFPEGTKIDTLQSSSLSGLPQKDTVDLMNKEISKLINSVTMISESGSSLSQSLVHEKMFRNIINSDLVWLKSEIENNLLPFLGINGFNAADKKVFFKEPLGQEANNEEENVQL